MAMSRDQYVEMLKGLLPRGIAWPRALGTDLHKLFDAMAEEMVRFDVRVSQDLVNEADPNTTLELLSDWERVVGIPDGAIPLGGTTAQRRNQILSKLSSTGGQSREFFIALAALLGFAVTITEFRPFRAGISAAGDGCNDISWNFAWRVNAPLNTVVYFSAGVSAAGDPVAVWSNGVLEAVIRKVKPAHTAVIFSYT